MSQHLLQKSKSPFFKNPKIIGIIAGGLVLLIIIIVVIIKLVTKKPSKDSPSNSPSLETESKDLGSTGQPLNMDQNQPPPGLIKYSWTLNNKTGQTLGLVSLFDNVGHSSVVNDLTTSSPNTYDISFLANQEPKVMVKSGNNTISMDAQGNPIPLPRPGNYNITGSTGAFIFTFIPPEIMPNTSRIPSMRPSRPPI